MGLRDEPHYRIAASELAAWIEGLGADRWWNVDAVPAPHRPAQLSLPRGRARCRAPLINRPLLVHDRRQPASGRGEQIFARDLDKLVTRLGDNVHGVKTAPWVDDRLFFLCWVDRGDDWLLVEDEETTESSRLDASVSPSVGKSPTMPRPPVDLHRKVLEILDHVDPLPAEASAPLAHYNRSSTDLWNLLLYVERAFAQVDAPAGGCPPPHRTGSTA